MSLKKPIVVLAGLKQSASVIYIDDHYRNVLSGQKNGRMVQSEAVSNCQLQQEILVPRVGGCTIPLIVLEVHSRSRRDDKVTDIEIKSQVDSQHVFSPVVVFKLLFIFT